MIDESLEFAIAQLADGTLDAADADVVRAQIARSDEAQSVLASYEKMDRGFHALPTPPAINWIRFSTLINDRLDEADQIAPASYSSASHPMPWLKWSAGLAAAACLLVVAGIALRLHTQPSKTNDTRFAGGQLAVVGPAIEAPVGQVIQQIAIGPSAAVIASGENSQFGDAYGDAGVIVQPSRVVIASAVDAAQDSLPESSSTPY